MRVTFAIVMLIAGQYFVFGVILAIFCVIGAIVLLVFLFLDSQPGENEYGPSPKAAAA